MKEAKLQEIYLSIPESVEELTLGQFIALREAAPDDELSIMSVISGKPIDVLMSIRYTAREIQHVFLLMQDLQKSIEQYFSEENIKARLKTPKTVLVLDKVIYIPEDLNRYAYWATRKGTAMVMEEITSRSNGGSFDMTSRYAEILAHYLYCPYTEMKYDEDRAEEFIQVVNDLPLTVAIPLGNFILLDLRSCWQTSIKASVWILIQKSAKQTRAALTSLVRWLR